MIKFFDIVPFCTSSVIQVPILFYFITFLWYLELRSVWKTLAVSTAFFLCGCKFLQHEEQFAALFGILIAIVASRDIVNFDTPTVKRIKFIYNAGLSFFFLMSMMLRVK